jgi:hypothetical protein
MTAEAAAASAASLTWQCPLAQIVTDDLTDHFPWAHRHSVVLVWRRGHSAMFVAVDRLGRAVPFPGQSNPLLNLDALNGLLERVGVTLPGDMEPELLARTVRTLLIGPSGFVGSSAFWEREKESLGLWTDPSPLEGPELFRRSCRDPWLHRSDRDWTLHFSYFNTRGGVESWKVTGDAMRIRTAAYTSAVPGGTFLFPYG